MSIRVVIVTWFESPQRFGSADHRLAMVWALLPIKIRSGIVFLEPAMCAKSVVVPIAFMRMDWCALVHSNSISGCCVLAQSRESNCAMFSPYYAL